jgi:hypothetical protein
MTELSVVLCIACAQAVAQSRNEPWVDSGRTDDQLQEMVVNEITPERWYAKTRNDDELKP